MRLHRSFAAVALSALIAVQGPLLASPVLAQEGARQTLNVQGADIRRDLKAAGLSDKMTHDASFASSLQ